MWRCPNGCWLPVWSWSRGNAMSGPPMRCRRCPLPTRRARLWRTGRMAIRMTGPGRAAGASRTAAGRSFPLTDGKTAVLRVQRHTIFGGAQRHGTAAGMPALFGRGGRAEGAGRTALGIFWDTRGMCAHGAQPSACAGPSDGAAALHSTGEKQKKGNDGREGLPVSDSFCISMARMVS